MPCLMIQGTTSDAGKSLLVTALCRLARRRGLAVAPFKPQNMALNAAVTPEGGEIGRAQAVQAQAAGLSPHVDMNPVLLKPTTDTGAQVILLGRAISTLEAQAYHDYKRVALDVVLGAHRRLGQRYDLLLVEGAGSPAEINLRANDIANMGYATAVGCPVVLVADIDRGGVFAHLVGTLALLSEEEQALVQGFVINRFRGDLALLEPGLRWLEERTGKPVLGVLPYLHGLHLEAEDALDPRQRAPRAEALRVLAPVLPRISNHTDFDPLRRHPQVDFQYVGPGQAWPAADLVILPGSKAVAADLDWFRRQGGEAALMRHLRYGGKVIGLCGGLQMLGDSVADPLGLEGPPGETVGLGLLALRTTLTGDKRLTQTHGLLALGQAPVSGYEIHAGRSSGPALERPAVHLADGTTDGAISPDNQILATYLHGLFDHPQACDALLAWAGLANPASPDYQAEREQEIDRLADAAEAHLQVDRILALAQKCAPPTAPI